MAALKTYQSKGLERVELYPVASGQTILTGDCVVWNAGLTQAASAGANVGATSATTRIVGRAIENSTRNDGSNKSVIGVMLAEPKTWFQLPIWHGTPASAVANPNQIGIAYELRNSNVGFTGYGVDISATTNTKCAIMYFDTTDYPAWPGSQGGTTQGVPSAGTTQYPNAWVEFLGSATLCPAGR